MNVKFKVGEPLDPLVLLPGLLCDSRVFTDQLAAFPGTLSIDGFYAGCDRIVAMARDVLAAAPARFAVLGYSMGARVALEIVRHAPERVTRLALADTGVHAARAGERDSRYGLRDLGRSDGIEALVDAWLPPMLGAAAAQDTPLHARLRTMALSAGVNTFERQTEALLTRPALDTLLPAIAVPTAIIVGAQDRWSPIEQHRAIAEAIPGSVLHIIADAGHMAPAEAPAAFNAAIAQWLATPNPSNV